MQGYVSGKALVHEPMKLIGVINKLQTLKSILVFIYHCLKEFRSSLCREEELKLFVQEVFAVCELLDRGIMLFGLRKPLNQATMTLYHLPELTVHKSTTIFINTILIFLNFDIILL